MGWLGCCFTLNEPGRGPRHGRKSTGETSTWPRASQVLTDLIVPFDRSNFYCLFTYFLYSQLLNQLLNYFFINYPRPSPPFSTEFSPCAIMRNIFKESVTASVFARLNRPSFVKVLSPLERGKVNAQNLNLEKQ